MPISGRLPRPSSNRAESQMHVCTDGARAGSRSSSVHAHASASSAGKLRSGARSARHPRPDRPRGDGRVPGSAVREWRAGRPKRQAKRRHAPLPARLEAVRTVAAPSQVLIAGAGVAGLETLLALHSLAGDRVEVTILAPEAKFINRPMSVDAPFKPKRVRGLKLAEVAREFGATWRRGMLSRVDHERHVAVTADRDEIAYDRLVLAMGARPEWESDAQSYCDGHDAEANRLMLHQL